MSGAGFMSTMESAIANISKRLGGFTPLTLSPEDLNGHVFILGMGQAPQDTFLRLIEARMNAGDTLALIDPSDTLADRSLIGVPQARTNELIFFEPISQQTSPLGINPLYQVHPDSYNAVATDITKAIEGVFVDSWGSSSNWMLLNSVLALLHHPEGSLVDISELLTNVSFRARVLNRITNQKMRIFWDGEFASYSRAQRADKIGPILNKVGSFWMNPIQKGVLEGKRTVNPRAILERGQLFIAKLPTRQLRSDTTNLLGSLLISLFISAAHEHNASPKRKDLLEGEPKKPKPLYLFVEDASQFSAPTINSALDGGGLSLVTRCESLDLLSDTRKHQDVLRKALLRADTIISFRVGVDDAEVLSNIFNRQYLPDEFAYLDEGEMRIKTKRDGKIEMFRGVALPPTQYIDNRSEPLIQHSLFQYGRRKKNRHVV